MADALYQAFTGWEVPFATTGGTTLNQFDVNDARSGRGYMKLRIKNAAQHQGNGETFKLLNGFSTADGGVTCPDGGNVVTKTRFYVRIRELPSGPAFSLFNWNGPVQMGVGVKANGTWFIWNSAGGWFAEGNETASATVLDLDVWHEIVFTATVSPNSGTCSSVNRTGCDTVTVEASIDGEVLSMTRHTAAFGVSISLNNMRLSYVPQVYSGSSFSAACGTCEFDFDDWVIAIEISDAGAAAPVLPTHTRVAACQLTGAGASTDWSANWWQAVKFVRDGHTGYQTSLSRVGAGARQTFTMQSLAEITGDPLATCGGVQVYVYCSMSTGSFRPSLEVGGVTVSGWAIMHSPTFIPASISNYASLPHYADFVERNAAAFDALTIGINSVGTTETNVLYGLPVEVLHNSEFAHTADEHGETALARGTANGFRLQWHEWTGDGAGRRDISTPGFYPHLVLVWEINDASVGASLFSGPMMKTIDMPGNYCIDEGRRTCGDMIERLTSTGFVVSNGLNVSGKHYIAMVVRDDGNAVGGRVLATGCFTPGTLADSVVFGYSTPIAPTMLFIMGGMNGAASNAYWHSEHCVANETYSFRNGATIANSVQSLDANGFSYGTTNNWGSAGVLYFALANTPEGVANRICSGKTTGAATDTIVDPVSASPPYLVVMRGRTAAMTHSTDFIMRMDEAEFIVGVNANFLGGPARRPAAVGIESFDAIARTFTINGNNLFNDDAPTQTDSLWLFFSSGFDIEGIETGWEPEPPAPFDPDEDLIGATVGIIWFELYLPE